MTFGFCIGDLVVLCQRVYDLVRTIRCADKVFEEILVELHALNAALVEVERLKEHKNLAGQETSDFHEKASSIPNRQGIIQIATILAHLQHSLNEYSERYKRRNGTRFLGDQDRAKFGVFHKQIHTHMMDLRRQVQFS